MPLLSAAAKLATLERLRRMAEGRGGACLAEVYESNKLQLPWVCKEGHKWSALPKNVERGSWCPRCAKRGPTTTNKGALLASLQEVAAAKGGRVVSEVYEASKAPVTFECGLGHQWQATPNNVKVHGSWCPSCAEAQLASMRAQERAKKAPPARTAAQREAETQAAMEARLEACRAHAKGKHGACLAEGPLKGHQKVLWRCQKRHRWEATPSSVLGQGAWCPVCAHTKPLTLHDMQVLAKRHHGKCLATEYKSVTTKLPWCCSKGHEWQATPASIKYQKSWCPTCNPAGRKKKARRHRVAA